MQDTPANKVTYTANITTTKEFVVKMSANDTSVASNDTHSISSFNCSLPIPTYLIAIAVGDLVSRDLGGGVIVITEPSEIDAVATEL